MNFAACSPIQHFGRSFWLAQEDLFSVRMTPQNPAVCFQERMMYHVSMLQWPFQPSVYANFDRDPPSTRRRRCPDVAPLPERLFGSRGVMIPTPESESESDFHHFSEIFYSNSGKFNFLTVLELIPKSDIYDSDSDSSKKRKHNTSTSGFEVAAWIAVAEA